MPKQKQIAKSSKKVRTKRATPLKRKISKKVAQKKRFRVSLPMIIFLIGTLFLAISLVYHTEQLINLTFYHQQLPPTNIHRTSKPVEITIDSVDIDLPVVETVIANNTWQIADNGISHLSNSARPGEDGTIILYGHNTDDRFGPIRWMNIGDKIVLTTTDTKTYTYVVTNISTVDPNNTKILTSQKGDTLILYTCTGFADLQRYVLIAKPKK